MHTEKRKIFKTHRVGMRESRELKKSQVWQRKPFLGKVRSEEFSGMLGLGWPSLMPKALRSSMGQGGIQRRCGEARVGRRSRFFLSVCGAQAAVVWGTQRAFQILFLPFCVPGSMSDDQRCAVFKEFHQSLTWTQEELLTEITLL